MNATPRRLALPCILALLAGGCMSLEYDLSDVSMPVSAKAVDAESADIEPFVIQTKSVLYLHGLFGHEPPDVGALLAERAQGFDGVAGLRVTQSPVFHDWLVTHLTLSLIRMKTVRIEGQLVREGSSAEP